MWKVEITVADTATAVVGDVVGGDSANRRVEGVQEQDTLDQHDMVCVLTMQEKGFNHQGIQREHFGSRRRNFDPLDPRLVSLMAWFSKALEPVEDLPFYEGKEHCV